ncbi:MAG TPA: hypothetical protein VEK75_06055 [Xanthobacteraceae bacterium]|nr:hypothetical protein [Xanthobacteraceae bacterium]
MRQLAIWIVELAKVIGRRRRHPLLTECPICRQRVRLHVNKAGRRHVLAHARGLYEGCRLSVHYAAEFKCVGSGSLMIFDPRPDEHQRFNLPQSLREGR